MKCLALLILLGFFLSSCATIINGHRERVYITADRPNTRIYVDRKLMGTDSVHPLLVRSHSHIVDFRNYNCFPITDTIKIKRSYTNLLSLFLLPVSAVLLGQTQTYNHHGDIYTYPDQPAVSLGYFIGFVFIPITLLVDWITESNHEFVNKTINVEMKRDSTKKLNGIFIKR